MKNVLKINSEDSISPVQQLSELLADDMAAVNECIMAQMHSPVAIIPQLAGYLIAAGGKRVRPLLTLASTSLCGGENPLESMSRAHSIAACVEFIHSATLLHDDVVDESEQRRGQETANLVFGNQASVLVGDFLFSRAFQLMTADGSLDVLKILSDASAVIAEGEVMQLNNTGKLDITMEDYLGTITAKTAALFAAACEVGPVIAGSDEQTRKALAEYGLNLGIAFQIADDILDYAAAHEKLGKAIGDDFREGKVTAPILFAKNEEPDFWARVISEEDHQREGDLKHALSLFKKTNALSQSRDLAQSYAQKAKDALTPLDESEIKSILCSLSDYTVQREY